MLQDPRLLHLNPAQIPRLQLYLAKNLQPIQENSVSNYSIQGLAPPVLTPLLPSPQAHLGPAPSPMAPVEPEVGCLIGSAQVLTSGSICISRNNVSMSRLLLGPARSVPVASGPT